MTFTGKCKNSIKKKRKKHRRIRRQTIKHQSKEAEYLWEPGLSV